MVAAVRKQRQLMATEAMVELGPVKRTPGADLTGDGQLRAALRQQLQPTYSRLCSTCSMMRREYSGVARPDLLVYRVQRLSVVNASTIPLIPAAQRSSTVYALVKKVNFFSKRHNICLGFPLKFHCSNNYGIHKFPSQVADTIKRRHRL